MVMFRLFRPMMMRHIFAKNLMPIPGCEQQGCDEQQERIGKQSAHQIRVRLLVKVTGTVKLCSLYVQG